MKNMSSIAYLQLCRNGVNTCVLHSSQRERESDILYIQIMIKDAKLLLGDFKQKILTVSGGSFIT